MKKIAVPLSAHRLRIGAVALGVAFAAACDQPSSRPDEPVGVAASPLTIPNRICADWQPYQHPVNLHCEDTQKVEWLYHAARTKAGAQAASLSVWVHWPTDEGHE